MTTGERIKLLREARKVTQTELAQAIKTTKQNIYKYENNIISNIPSDKIEMIAKFFSVSPAYLMGWEDGMAIDPDFNFGFPMPVSIYTKEKDKKLQQQLQANKQHEKIEMTTLHHMDEVNRSFEFNNPNPLAYLPLLSNSITHQQKLIYFLNDTRNVENRKKMYPLIFENDIVLLDYGAKANNGDFVLIEEDFMSHFICRYFKYEDFLEFQFQCDKPIRIANSDKTFNSYTVLGVVKQIIKNIE